MGAPAVPPKSMHLLGEPVLLLSGLSAAAHAGPTAVSRKQM